MELLDLKHDLLVSIVALNFPAAEVQSDDLFTGEVGLIQQVGEEYRNGSIRADESDNSELNDFGLLALSAAESLEEAVGGMEQNVALLTAAANKFFHRREGALSRTAKKKVAIVVVSQRADELIARISTIKKENSSMGDG
jgi:hypothetical protein